MNATATTTTDTQFSPTDCRELCDRLHQWIGIVVDPGKTYLIRGRLRELMASVNAATLGDLNRMCVSPTGQPVRQSVIDAMTTHETLFFRDSHPFETIANDWIPEILTQKPASQRLRIHCLACSTGQEPYSLAMRMTEVLSPAQLARIALFASDVSQSTIQTAQAGEYLDHEIHRGLSPERQARFLRAVPGEPGLRRSRMVDSIRSLVQFGTLNLNQLSTSPQTREPLDLCLCRNVLIYFSDEDRRKILAGLAGWIRPGGMLIIGSSEMLRPGDGPFQRIMRQSTAMYQRI